MNKSLKMLTLAALLAGGSAANAQTDIKAAKPVSGYVQDIRDNVVVHEGKLSTLKRFKDEVKEVPAGQECGMAFEKWEDMRVGDVIECYRVEQVKRSL